MPILADFLEVWKEGGGGDGYRRWFGAAAAAEVVLVVLLSVEVAVSEVDEMVCEDS